MQIFYKIVVLLSCLWSLQQLTFCVAQQTNNTSAQRPCPLLRSCNRTNVEVCATNGQHCKRFLSDCELHRENCNATLATAWNRTNSIQCSNIRSNASGLCACSTEVLSQCSNRTLTTGICAYGGPGGGGLGSHLLQCQLFRTECDLRRARCNNEEWQTIEQRQCRGFSLNQSNACHCPKLLQCSSLHNQTQSCVQVGENRCRLYGSECDLESHRCDGERLQNVDILQCGNFRVNQTKDCSCPHLLQCNRNSSSICVRNAEGKCLWMRDECDLERGKCAGNVLSTVLPLQCRRLAANETGTCSCPALETCSRNNTNICTQTRTGCELQKNECDFEQAKCQDEAIRNVSSLQCLRFQPGDKKPCTCPGVMTCSRNNTNICVKSSHGCILMQNECDLEEARCRGNNLTVVDMVQCREFTPNQLRNCSCPNIGSCDTQSENVCVTTSTKQCKLMRNECDLEKAKCTGEVLNRTSLSQCRNFPLNTVRNCSCPSLLSCQRNSSALCTRDNNNQCQLLANECELALSSCEGRDLQHTHAVHCLNFQINQAKTCLCSQMLTCSRNSTKVCVKTRRGCKLLTTRCQAEEAKCRGEALAIIDAIHCQGFQLNEEKSCFCSNLKTCSRNETQVCIKSNTNCTLLRNECEVEQYKCTNMNVTVLPSLQCRSLLPGQSGSCLCPSLLNCNRNNTSICFKTRRGCGLLRNECELEELKCQSGNVTVLPTLQCGSLTPGQNGSCFCPQLNTCNSNSTNICIRTATGCNLLKNECVLEELKCRGENVTVLPSMQCRTLLPGQGGLCSCPKLLTCNRNTTDICVKIGTGCSRLKNDCELEELSCQREKELKCRGENVTVLPSMQCRALLSGQGGLCSCPKLLTCNRNTTDICIKIDTGCSRLTNECELEELKCQGGNVTIMPSLQCQSLTTGQSGSCFCPKLKTCNNNSTNICIKTATGCNLLKNECTLEELKCRADNVTVLPSMQCRALLPEQGGLCSCPKLLTCNRNTTDICVKIGTGCSRLKNECELEELNCQGQNVTILPSLQCQSLTTGQSGSCFCPNLKTCNRNNTNICLKTRTGCNLLKNECDLEELKCRGENTSVVPFIQCQTLQPGQNGSCYCPKLLTCNRNITNICIKTADGCSVLQNECALEELKCRGETITILPAMQCRSVTSGQSGTCACPNLLNCSQNITKICVRTPGGCKLLRNQCEMEKIKCRGEAWSLKESIQCHNFASDYVGKCYCPKLNNCPGRTISGICAEIRGQCKYFKNRCKLEKSQCLAEGFIPTSHHRCRGIRYGTQAACRCPELLRCNRRQGACGKKGDQCKLFRNDCDHKKAICSGDKWQRTSMENCCQFHINQSKKCALTRENEICGRTSGQACRLFTTRCQLNAVNANLIRKYKLVDRSHCKCLSRGRSGRCIRKPTCTAPDGNERKVCARLGNQLKWFNSQCQLSQNNYNTCKNFRTVSTRTCRNIRNSIL